MSELVIDYRELQSIADNASSLSQKAESYCDELQNNVYNSFAAVTYGVNDILSSAQYFVSAKQQSLKDKAEEYAAFSGKVISLIEHANQADKEVARKIENNQDAFLKNHSEIRAADGIEAFLINLFIEVKNANPLFEIVADIHIAIKDFQDSIVQDIKYWYRCGGGKEVVKIALAIGGLCLAIAGFIAVFPISLALSLSTFVSVCGLIGAGIGVINASTNLVTSCKALKSTLEGNPAWASIYGEQDKLSDVIRQTNFGDGMLNKLSYGVATGLDVTEAACNTIFIVGSLKSLGTKIKANRVAKNNLNAGADFFVGPNGKALPKEYKNWIGDNIQGDLLAKTDNPKLQNAIKQLFRKESFIGNGGTADVIRFEKETGIMLGRNNGSHVQKGIDMAKYLENKILTQELSSSDREIAVELLKDLKKALGD